MYSTDSSSVALRQSVGDAYQVDSGKFVMHLWRGSFLWDEIEPTAGIVRCRVGELRFMDSFTWSDHTGRHELGVKVKVVSFVPRRLRHPRSGSDRVVPLPNWTTDQVIQCVLRCLIRLEVVKQGSFSRKRRHLE